MKQAIQFGAGNIGRGFIGALLSQSEYEVVFADVNTEMINALNQTKSYTVYVTDLEPEKFTVKPISALHTSDPLLIKEIINADIITTAVGLNILPKIAPVIAQGIEERAKQQRNDILHIIACENGIRASRELKNAVYDLLPTEALIYADEWIAFVDCSVDRIVPPLKTDNLTDVCVERFFDWNVDCTQLKSDLAITGMHAVDNLDAYIERKLFTLNTAHAVTAYLGHLRGYDTIEQCIADPEILEIVRAVMAENGAVLVKKFGLDAEEHAAYCEKIVKRFRNYYLNDIITRIGRDPLRKLAANDRLIAPLKTAFNYGLPADNLLLGIGAALHYQYPSDPESNQLQKMIRTLGLPAAIEKITGIPTDSPINVQIVNAYKKIAALSPLIVRKVEIISTSGIEAKLVAELLKKAKEYHYDILLKYKDE